MYIRIFMLIASEKVKKWKNSWEYDERRKRLSLGAFTYWLHKM